ncbi:MAG: hypothetical protein J6J87_01995 [Oscillospiraceae bacterium]|nr:hypothetical protein [Oscillospiraceae bacterium]
MEFSLLEQWPKDASGQLEEKALLCKESDFPDLVQGLSSFLTAFGIPHYIKNHGSGEYMNFLFGHSATDGGVEFYVPASRLDEARELLAAPPIFEDEPEE